MKDFYSVKHWFVYGQYDYITYYKGGRNWVENELSFVESDAFRKAKLDVLLGLFRILLLKIKLWATGRRSARWYTPRSSMRDTISCMTNLPSCAVCSPPGLLP